MKLRGTSEDPLATTELEAAGAEALEGRAEGVNSTTEEKVEPWEFVPVVVKLEGASVDSLAATELEAAGAEALEGAAEGVT